MSAPEATAATAARQAPPDGRTPRGAVPPGTRSRVLSGWGLTSPSRAQAFQPRDPEEVLAALAAARGPRGLIARGAGRSYGDAAQNANGLVLETSALHFIEEPDEERQRVRVGAGTTLGELMRQLVGRGLTLPVTPGTKHVTVGGAIAADVHGKNGYSDGSFARHVDSLTLVTPGGEMLALAPRTDGELFRATLGGMGLTGVVVDATLRLERLRSSELCADIDSTPDIEGALALMADAPPRHRYAIAWLDLLGGASRRTGGIPPGRSVVLRSDYAQPSTPGSAAVKPVTTVSERARLTVPGGMPGGLLRTGLVRAFNEARWRRSPRQARERPLGLEAHFFPLDVLGYWNRLYRPSGLIQYQFVVPAGHEDALLRVVRLLQQARLPMYLVVLKRLGSGSGGPLSFPLDGFTLAIDIPAAAVGIAATLDRADELVAEAGGRVYLAKDARLRAEALRAMYPELDRLGQLRARLDPRGVLQSDMARRLGLCDGRGRSAR